MLAIKFALFDSFSQTFMVDEMATWKFPQKRFLRVLAHHALKFFNLYVEFLALNNVPSVVFGEVRGICAGEKVVESFVSGEFHSDEALICV